MNGLIKVTYSAGEPTVSARDLHEGLEIKTAFKDWFPRMIEYGFEAGKDFNMLKNERVQMEGNREVRREITDYQISVDMAKQICMIQRTDKGKQYREYFLDLEKAWNSPEAIMARALQMANKSIDSLKEQCKFLGGQLVEQQKLIAELQPKANYVDTILSSRSLVVTTQIAKDYGMTATTLNKILHDMGIQYKNNGQWVLYHPYQGKGYVSSKTIKIERRDGRADVVMQTQWTQKGRLFLYEHLKKEKILPLIELDGTGERDDF